MLRLEGRALLWHQFLAKNQKDFYHLGWEQYVHLLRERFNPGGLDDSFSELLSLRQAESVEQFYEEFIHLLNQVQLPDEYVLCMLKNHLRIEISQYLQLLQPKNIIDAFHLAKHLEKVFFQVQKKMTWKNPRTSTPAPLSLPARTSNSEMKNVVQPGSVVASTFTSRNSSPSRLSPTGTKNQGTTKHKGTGKTISAAEIEDRRKRGLCFWCAAKYSPGHKCARSQLF
ncbi:hypothetical protein HRI_000009600 [Hibiscus trionum]|uniref:Retrotransposon gag domain-containing protein n=1 Tax=Hibiscus trionum TaxID=183268 RepID=A0A9W7GQ93_HIBTR|nr:hypothetical protein HRI_000009600 [Hibiscus trionum]